MGRATDPFDTCLLRVFSMLMAERSVSRAAGQLLAHDSTQSRLVLIPLGHDFDYEAALANGELDVVIGNWPQPPEHLRMTILLEDEVVCLVSRDHPRAGSQLTVADYLNSAHIVPLTYGVMERGVVESHMAALRLSREPTVTVPYFSMAPSLLLGTDLIFTTSSHFAEHYTRQLPLAVLNSPIDFPAMRF